MNRREFLRHTAIGCALPLVAGCGAFKRAVNDSIDPVANPGDLQGKHFPLLITSRSSGKADGAGTFTGPFSDIAPVNRQNLLNFVEFTQNLRGEIQLVLFPTADLVAVSLPSRLILRDVSLAVRLFESDSIGSSPSREVVIPNLRSQQSDLTFVRLGDTDRYIWDQSGEIRLGAVRLEGGPAKQLFALLTGAGTQGTITNFVSAAITGTVIGEGLEALSAVLLTFGKGEARVGI